MSKSREVGTLCFIFVLTFNTFQIPNIRWLWIHAVYFHIFVGLTPLVKEERRKDKIKLKMFPNLMTLWFAFYHAVIFVHGMECSVSFSFELFLLNQSMTARCLCAHIFGFLLMIYHTLSSPNFNIFFFVPFRFYDQTTEFNLNEYHLFFTMIDSYLNFLPLTHPSD